MGIYRKTTLNRPLAGARQTSATVDSAMSSKDSARARALTTRSRTNTFVQYRDSLKTHRKVSRDIRVEQKEHKVNRNLLSISDDEGSAVDARIYTVPPVWVTMVDDLNRDVASIERIRAFS